MIVLSLFHYLIVICNRKAFSTTLIVFVCHLKICAFQNHIKNEQFLDKPLVLGKSITCI